MNAMKSDSVEIKLKRRHSNFHGVSHDQVKPHIELTEGVKSVMAGSDLEIVGERPIWDQEDYKSYRERCILSLVKRANQRKARREQLELHMNRNGYSEEKKKVILKVFQEMESNFSLLRRSKMTVSMFEFVCLLGTGGYGNVFLARKKDTKNVYALKLICKKDSISKRQMNHIKSERDILSEADSIWIVKLYYSFQDKKALYFVLEYLPGGDLMSLLIDRQIFRENWAKFYISELVLAIEYVHSLKFCHRDIKPDNILIAADGHIKLCDFGLSTEFQINDAKRQKLNRLQKLILKSSHRKRQKRNSLVGTLNYIAPEVLTGDNYSSSCDWWSVGIILYEMVFGRPLFWSDSDYETHLKIVNWDKHICFPQDVTVSHMCVKLILHFCCDANSRLGKFGANEVKHHPFFRGLDWANLRSIRPPFIPILSDEVDVSHFVNRDTGCIDPTGDRGDQSTQDNTVYGFSFKRFFNKTAKIRYMQILRDMKNGSSDL